MAKKETCTLCKKPLSAAEAYYELYHCNYNDCDTHQLFCGSDCLIVYLIKDRVDPDSFWAYKDGFDNDLWLKEMVKRITQILVANAALRNGST